MFSEATGPTLKKSQEKREFHISISPGENATVGNPSWLVSHRDAKDDSPVEEHRFHDGRKMLEHVASAVGVPKGGE